MNQNVEQVSAMAVELRDRVCKLLEHANKLAGTLSGSVDAYNKFASTLNKQVVSQINAIDDKMHKNRIELETISKKDEGKLDAKEAVLQITNIVDTDNMENLQKKLQQ
jgi:DNA anti-recombination protein RmuC